MRYAIVILSLMIALLLAFELWITLGSMQPGAGLGILWIFPPIGLHAVLTLILGAVMTIPAKMPSSVRWFGGVVILASILWVPMLYGVMLLFESTPDPSPTYIDNSPDSP